MLQLWGCKESDTTEGLSDEGKSSLCYCFSGKLLAVFSPLHFHIYIIF